MGNGLSLFLWGKVYNKEDFILKKIALRDLKFLDEIDILNPKPKKISIGDKFIIIKELPLSSIEKLRKEFSKLMKKFKVLEGVSIPENLKELNQDMDKFEDTIKVVETLLQIPRFRKVFSRMLKTIMPEIGSRGFPTLRYIENMITLTGALNIIIAVWAYNFVADIESKKKIQEVVKDLMKA